MLGVKDSGRAPMAWSIRPGFRGDLVLCDDGSSPSRDPIAYGPGMNLQGGAQSVACLEVGMREKKTRQLAVMAITAAVIASGNHTCKRG